MSGRVLDFMEEYNKIRAMNERGRYALLDFMGLFPSFLKSFWGDEDKCKRLHFPPIDSIEHFCVRVKIDSPEFGIVRKCAPLDDDDDDATLVKNASHDDSSAVVPPVGLLRKHGITELSFSFPPDRSDNCTLLEIAFFSGDKLIYLNEDGIDTSYNIPTFDGDNFAEIAEYLDTIFGW